MDWTRFIRKIRIDRPVSEVFDAWINTEKLATWFLESAVIQNRHAKILLEGDTVTWKWHNYDQASDIQILEIILDSKIVFTFGHGMEVQVSFLSEKDKTILSLLQYNIPTDEKGKEHFHIGCRQAWSTWLLNLKSWMEEGVTLHDKELGMREDLFDFVNT